MAKNLLFIIYFFPPLGGAGVQRPLKFVKYLPDFGWLPHVLTTTDEATYPYKDYSLVNEIPNVVVVERVADRLDILAGFIAGLPGVPWLVRKIRGKPSENYARAIRNHLLRIKFFEFPDGQLTWAISAYFRALKLVKKHQFTAILTTSAPYSSHLIGYCLKKASGIPWAADFRDEWSKNPLLVFPTKLHFWLARKLESLVLKNADWVINTTEPITDTFKKLSGRLGKFSTITNGFDEHDFTFAKEKLRPRNDKKFYLTNVGTYYEDPVMFQVVESLLINREIAVDDFRLVIVGKFSSQYHFNNPSWNKVIFYTGYLDHEQALMELLNSSALFFIFPQKGGTRYFPGKIFEYIKTGKPIISLVPPNSIAADLIRNTHTGLIVSPDDIPAIRSAVLKYYREWKAGRLEIEPNETLINKYSRHNLTADLAALLEIVSINNKSE